MSPDQIIIIVIVIVFIFQQIVHTVPGPARSLALPLLAVCVKVDMLPTVLAFVKVNQNI